MGDITIPKRDATLPAEQADWSDPRIQAAALAVMQARVRWGWSFGRKPKVMAIDQIMAEAALRAASEIARLNAASGDARPKGLSDNDLVGGV